MRGLQHKHCKMLKHTSEERPRPTSQQEEITGNLQGKSFCVVVYIEADGKGNRKELVKLKRRGTENIVQISEVWQNQRRALASRIDRQE